MIVRSADSTIDMESSYGEQCNCKATEMQPTIVKHDRKHSKLCALFQAQTASAPTVTTTMPTAMTAVDYSGSKGITSHSMRFASSSSSSACIECTFGTENTLRGVKIYTKVKCLPVNRCSIARSFALHIQWLGYPLMKIHCRRANQNFGKPARMWFTLWPHRFE